MTEQYCFLSCRLSVTIDIDIEIFICFCLYFFVERTCTQEQKIRCQMLFFNNSQNFTKITPKRGVTVTSVYYHRAISRHLLSPLCRLLSQPRRALQHLHVILRSGNFFFTLSFIFAFEFSGDRESLLQATHDDSPPPPPLFLWLRRCSQGAAALLPVAFHRRSHQL